MNKTIIALVVGGFIGILLIVSIVFGYIAKKTGEYEAKRKDDNK